MKNGNLMNKGCKALATEADLKEATVI